MVVPLGVRAEKNILKSSSSHPQKKQPTHNPAMGIARIHVEHRKEDESQVNEPIKTEENAEMLTAKLLEEARTNFPQWPGSTTPSPRRKGDKGRPEDKLHRNGTEKESYLFQLLWLLVSGLPNSP